MTMKRAKKTRPARDPVFPAIAEKKRLEAVFSAIAEEDSPAWKRAEKAMSAAGAALARTVPTTGIGLSASLRVLVEDAGWSLTPYQQRWLRSLISGAVKLTR